MFCFRNRCPRLPCEAGGRAGKEGLSPAPHPASERLLCQGDGGLGLIESPAPTPRARRWPGGVTVPRSPTAALGESGVHVLCSFILASVPVHSTGTRHAPGPGLCRLPRKSLGSQPWGVSQLPEASGLPAEPEIGSSECEGGGRVTTGRGGSPEHGCSLSVGVQVWGLAQTQRKTKTRQLLHHHHLCQLLPPPSWLRTPGGGGVRVHGLALAQ